MTSKPWWRSKRWAGLVLGALLLVLMQCLGADPDVCTPLAWGVGAALTALVGGESLVDARRAKREVERDREP